MNPTFWQNKRVLITGHTGFKGSWLSLWLEAMGAEVIGYALPPTTNPNLFTLARVAENMTSIMSDVRDAEALTHTLQNQKLDVVFHLAAQPLVRLSYLKPTETFATNIMGTVNLLEAIRTQTSVRAVVVITSDKCYENREWIWGYRENEPMGGLDPYSSSKGCAELICAAYRASFLRENGVALATARAGNVIGGGDWSEDRLVPDILRSIEKRCELVIRHPSAMRPWQHVLEPLSGYLLLAERLWEKGDEFASAWNFGPLSGNVRSVKWIIDNLSAHYSGCVNWRRAPGVQLHEANLLSLDSTKARTLLGWQAQWDLQRTLLEIVNWHRAYTQNKNMREVSLQLISSYSSTFKTHEVNSDAASN